MVPPLRTVRDRAALRAGVADGTIDLICSDHAPVDDDGKQVPSARRNPVPPDWNSCCRSRSNGLRRRKSRCRRRSPKSPASRRSCSASRPATFALAATRTSAYSTPINTGRSNAKALKSQGKNTPFLGMEIPGKVRFTLVAGHVVHDA